MSIKIERLKEDLAGMGRVAVALSGGLDSSIMLACAVSVLGRENCLAVTSSTPYMMQDELNEAEKLGRQLGVEHLVLHFDTPEEIRDNPPLRCYICKLALFREVIRTAEEKGFDYVLDGTNKDDEGDYRPGHRALEELGVLSPLKEAGLGKTEIRDLGRSLGLDETLVAKPAYACLLTRMEHGVVFKDADLKRIDNAEKYLRGLGFAACRVRTHGKVARIEIPPENWPSIFRPGVTESIVEYLKSIGFSFVSLDLSGYRQGSMNKRIRK